MNLLFSEDDLVPLEQLSEPDPVPAVVQMPDRTAIALNTITQGNCLDRNHYTI